MKGMPTIVSVIVFVLLAILVLNLLGAIIGFAIKAVLLVAAAGVAYVVYKSAAKRIGGPRG